jgi:lysozyme
VDVKTKLAALGLAGALAIIPIYEGTFLKRYIDPVGIPTDCTGHTGPDVRAVNTQAQCDEKLSADILTANKVVDSCVTVPLNPNQRSAFVSFAFNVGRGGKGIKDGFCELRSGGAPSFLRKLNAKDYAGACNGLNQWVNAGGKPLPGLVKRRQAESALCMKGVV